MFSLKITILHLIFLSSLANGATPTKFGCILYPGFTVLDVFGPLEALGGLSYMTPNLNLNIIAETLEPVPSGKTSFWTNLANSSVLEWVLPTHTFETAPPLDVLIIPGGLGSLPPAPLLNSTIAFVKERYPTLQYLITVCVGAGIAASAGVLDGKHATTNKQAWDATIALGPKVKWVPQARWVTDGNIWTTSGVSAGIDGFLAFLAEIYGDTAVTTVANGMEYTRHLNSTDDPFATLYNLTDTNNGTNLT